MATSPYDTSNPWSGLTQGVNTAGSSIANQLMMNALLKHQQQQQNWQKLNTLTNQGGIMKDAYGNPIGPAAGSAGDAGSGGPLNTPAPAPGAGNAWGAGAPPVSYTGASPFGTGASSGMTTGQGMYGSVPYMQGTSGTPQAAAYQAPSMPVDPMSALFSSGFGAG